MLILVALAHQSLRSRRLPPGAARAASASALPPAKEIQ
jgi:multicomponent K+:H+ antiporter subunit A